jgi:outer membrane protein
MLAKYNPGTDDYKKHENKVTELKASYEAKREQAERDFAAKEAEAMATLYK